MNEPISKQFAIELLNDDAKRIMMLIRNQKNSLCISQCKAFEEVVDTQMYGFSRQVTYAIRLGILSNEEGHKMLSNLERELNTLYSEVYEKRQEKNETSKEG
ncbi:YlaN family protein [Enterococcus faecalis]